MCKVACEKVFDEMYDGEKLIGNIPKLLLTPT